MLPRILIDSAAIPGGDTLRLFQRGREYSIMLGGNELMNSRTKGSEEALARLGCAHLAGRTDARVLIGGYGMGFTLRAAMALLRRDSRVTVAELVPQIIDWARGPMAELTAGCLDDPRVAMVLGDVGATIRAGRAVYDAILLDVDNGPDGLTRAGNDSLYGDVALSAARGALRAGGVLCVWSAAPDDRFAKRFASAGFSVEQRQERTNNGRGARHVIWLGTRTG